MAYVNGFLFAVPAKNREAYLKVASASAAVFKDHGALEQVECWGDDVPDGKLTSFPKAVQKKDDEVVVLSWVLWPSKEVCTAGMEAAMKDPRMAQVMDPKNMPFDGQRMVWGGFEEVFRS